MVEYTIYLFNYFNLLSDSWKMELFLFFWVLGFILALVLAEAVAGITLWLERFLPKHICKLIFFILSIKVLIYITVLTLLFYGYWVLFITGVDIW